MSRCVNSTFQWDLFSLNCNKTFFLQKIVPKRIHAWNIHLKSYVDSLFLIRNFNNKDLCVLRGWNLRLKWRDYKQEVKNGQHRIQKNNNRESDTYTIESIQDTFILIIKNLINPIAIWVCAFVFWGFYYHTFFFLSLSYIGREILHSNY